MVEELKKNSAEYDSFVVGTTVEKEADIKFLDQRYFFGELGNCMPLAMANALGLPIFTNELSSCNNYQSPRGLSLI